MSKNLVVSFPGGKGTEIPLLYFASKFYEDKGYEKRFINHPFEGNELSMLFENAKKALSISDRAYVLETGKIVLEGKAEELLNNDSIKKAYLGE